jgi:hypothetical protein
MDRPQITPNAPTGFAFEIADLMLLQGWAEFHEVQMAFYAKDNALRRWILWRAPSEIVVQPLIGRSCRFSSVADALESLIPARS